MKLISIRIAGIGSTNWFLKITLKVIFIPYIALNYAVKDY